MRKAVEAGRIHLVDGKIDPVQADAEWARNTLAPTNGNGHGNGNGHKPPSEPPPPPASSAEPGHLDLNQQRARDYYYKAERERLELEREHGRIIDAAKTREEIFRAARILRDSLTTIPLRVAGRVAVETDPAKVEKLIAAEIDRALKKLNADLRIDAGQ